MGRVTDMSRQQGIPGLRMEAWDKELIFHDLVASTFMGHGGCNVDSDRGYGYKAWAGRIPESPGAAVDPEGYV